MRSVWFWILIFSCCSRLAVAQKITFVWDPERSAYTVAATTEAGRLYNKLKDAKEQIVLDKAYFVRDLIIINVLDGWLDDKQKEAVTHSDLNQVRALYEQTKQMVDDMWTDYDRIFIQTKDSVRQRTQTAFDLFKKVSDYKVGQVHRRYEKFVNDGSFHANQMERLLILQDCYDEMRRERSRVAKMASILYALASNPKAYAKDKNSKNSKNNKQQGLDLFKF